MIKIKDLSIGTKLMGSYGIIILFLLILLFAGFSGIRTIDNIYDENNRNIVPSLIAAKNIEISTWKLKDAVFSYGAGQKSARDEFQAALVELDKNIEESKKMSNSEERLKMINSITDAKMVEEMAAAAQEQSATVEEVTASIENVSSISQESATGTQETSETARQQSASMDYLVKAAQNLAQMSDELRSEAAKFKLDELSLKPAKHSK